MSHEPLTLTDDIVAETLERLNRPRMAALVRDLGRDAANRRHEADSLREQITALRARLATYERPVVQPLAKNYRSVWE
jgi:polyhydroxyalkanoate synthesis regulator phasin